MKSNQNAQECKIARDGNIKGSIGGVPASTTTKKIWLVAQALGDIAFAFPFSVILIEIQVQRIFVFS
ncbi:unnamed protein product [Camellia sinensis]